jgi:hypothetical protein
MTGIFRLRDRIENIRETPRSPPEKSEASRIFRKSARRIRISPRCVPVLYRRNLFVMLAVAVFAAVDAGYQNPFFAREPAACANS